MAKTRETSPAPKQKPTLEQAEAAFGEYAKQDAYQQKINAQMDIEITKVRDKYSDQLAEISEAKEKAYDSLRDFALLNREMFTDKKSRELTHGVIGFRTSPPALKLRPKFTWSAVVELLRDTMPQFIRTKEEPAKDELLAKREDPEVNKYFEKIGVRVEQEELFFVEPKKEELIAA